MFPAHALKFAAHITHGVHTNNSPQIQCPKFSGSCPESGSIGLNSIGIWTGPIVKWRLPAGHREILDTKSRHERLYGLRRQNNLLFWDPGHLTHTLKRCGRIFEILLPIRDFLVGVMSMKLVGECL